MLLIGPQECVFAEHLSASKPSSNGVLPFGGGKIEPMTGSVTSS